MPDPRFQSKTLDATRKLLETDDVAVTRRVNVSGGTFTVSSVWSGKGSLQEGRGSTYQNAAGSVEVADAILVVSNNVLASLPTTVRVGDVVQRQSDDKKFTVASTSTRTTLLPHSKFDLKVGPLKYDQK